MQPVIPVPPPAPWLGGKKRLAKHIARRIDAIPHKAYAEPFIGMGGVFFRRRRRPPVEIINDVDRDVATLFRVLQRHPVALFDDCLRWELAGRENFDRLHKSDPETLTDIERAARFYVIQKLAFGGKTSGRTFGAHATRASAFRISVVQKHLAALHARLEGVLIERLDFGEFLERYDTAETLFYLDPPYWGGENDYGRGKFRRYDFQRLARLVGALKGRFLLSLNDTPEVRRIFGEFHLEEVETRYTIGIEGRGTAIAELIIADEPPPAAADPRAQATMW